MSALEAAELFTNRLSRAAELECPCADCLLPLVEARDNAVRLALLDELSERAAQHHSDGRAPIAATTHAYVELRAKYAVKP